MKLRNYALSNGLKVAVLSDWHSPTTSILVDIHSGSRNDSEKYLGEHHAFEHVPFRGCDGFPNKNSWTYPLERHGVNIGANINTGLCRTRFSLNVVSDFFDMAAQHLSSLVYKPLLKPEHWRLERPVIIKELQKAQNTENFALFKNLLPILFPDSPRLHHSPLGTLDGINNIGIARLRYLHRKEYCINNSQLVVAGKLPKNWLQVMENRFGSIPLPQGESHKIATVLHEPDGERQTRTEQVFKQPFLSQFGLFSLPEPRVCEALTHFKTMLGVPGTMFNPLFMGLRERSGLIYNYGLNVNMFLPKVLRLSFSCHTSLEQVDKVAELFWQIVSKTFKDRKQFGFAKDRRMAKMKMRMFDSADDADDVADQMLYVGSYTSTGQRQKIVADLSFNEVRDAAEAYFVPKNFLTLVMKAN